jgi:hypothetical protein
VRQLVGVVALAAVLPACGFSPGSLGNGSDGGLDSQVDDPDALPDTPPPGPWLAGFGFRKQITITPPARGGSLADFPVALLRTSDADISTHARSDGRDLVVTSADALTPLDSELASFEPGTGALEIWARIPTLSLAGSTTLYLYYGGPATQTSPGTVWSANAGFASVWHLSTEAGTGAADSAPLANHLSVQGGDTSPAASAGIAGPGRSPMVATDRLLHTDNNTLDFASSSFSFSVWVRETAPVGLYDAPFYNGGTNNCCPGYGLLLGTGTWGVKIHDGGATNAYGTDFMTAGFGDQTALTGRWVHLVSVIDRMANQLRAYADGVLTDTQAMPNVGPLTSNVNLAIGRGSGGAWFNGLIDEARVYSVPLTAPWIATEHANLIDANFVAVGAQQTP